MKEGDPSQNTSSKSAHTSEVAAVATATDTEHYDVPETKHPPGLLSPADLVAIANDAAADVAKEARKSAEAIRTSAINETAVAVAEQVAIAAEAAAFRWAGSAANIYSGDVTAAVTTVADAARNAATTVKTAATPTEDASAISGAAYIVVDATEAAAFRVISARTRSTAPVASTSIPAVVTEHTDNSSSAAVDIHENQQSAAGQQGNTGR